MEIWLPISNEVLGGISVDVDRDSRYANKQTELKYIEMERKMSFLTLFL